MAEVIVIGAVGETWPYEAVGLTCFEPEREHVTERVQAEQVRCDVLAMTQATYDRLPADLCGALRQSVGPRLVIVPAARDVRTATEVIDSLRRTLAGDRFPHAA